MSGCARLLVIGVVSAASCAIGFADESEPLGVGFTTDYFSKYIWRGQNLNDESVLQPSVFLSKYGFTGTVWSNLDLTEQNDNEFEFTEVDYSLDYSNTFPEMDWLGYSAGVIHYRFPNTEFKATTEVYGGLSLPKVPLTPFVKIYRDIDEIDGSYIQAGVGHTFEKIKTWSDTCYCGLALGASVGYGTSSYNDGYFGVDKGALNDLTLSAGLPICLDSWTIKPSVNYSMMLADSIREATDRSDNMWYGLSISKTF